MMRPVFARARFRALRRQQLRTLTLLLTGLLLVASRVSAQDALGGEADFDDEWDAILKLVPPSAAPAAEPQRKATRAGERVDPGASERETARLNERALARASEREARDSEREARNSEREARISERAAARASEREARRNERGQPVAGLERSQPNAGKAPPVVGPPTPAEGYPGLVRFWHEPWPQHAGDQAIDQIAAAPPVLSLHPVGKTTTPYILLPNSTEGGFSEAQIGVASQAFGSWPGGPQVSTRLLDLVYHAARHFNVFHVHLVSGIRRDRTGSRHSHGLAADIVLPGVSDEELAGYFRPQGFVGVGIYTRAGFVHVDTREKSFFWLDKSPPDRRYKIIPVRGDEARQSDEAALLRGQSVFVNPPRLQKALSQRRKRRLEQAAAISEPKTLP